MLSISLQSKPSQTVKSVLDSQNCQISIDCKSQGCFVSVSVDGNLIVSSVIARDAVPIVCRSYAGFSGNLMFIDTQGNQDPLYTGIGTRWQLVYLSESENAVI